MPPSWGKCTLRKENGPFLEQLWECVISDHTSHFSLSFTKVETYQEREQARKHESSSRSWSLSLPLAQPLHHSTMLRLPSGNSTNLFYSSPASQHVCWCLHLIFPSHSIPEASFKLLLPSAENACILRCVCGGGGMVYMTKYIRPCKSIFFGWFLIHPDDHHSPKLWPALIPVTSYLWCLYRVCSHFPWTQAAQERISHLTVRYWRALEAGFHTGEVILVCCLNYLPLSYLVLWT